MNIDVDLSEPERAVWDAFPRAETIDLRTGDPARDDPATSRTWDRGRAVRADVLAALLLGAVQPEPGCVAAVRLRGALIIGQLDLSCAEVKHTVLLEGCAFEAEPRLDGARTPLVNLSHSHLPGLQLSDAQVDGLLVLDGCYLDGPLQLAGARVAGTLSLCGARLQGAPAMQADSLTVGRNMVCTDMLCTNESLLGNAHIGGTLMFNRARLENPSGWALGADGLIAERGFFCHDGFAAIGEVRLHDARIGRRFTMAGASLRNPGGTALGADRLTVDGAARLDKGFHAEGMVVLHGTTVRGELNMSGAKLSNPSGIALNADRATIESGLYMGDGFVALGEVSLRGTYVRGSIHLARASLRNPGGKALSADSLDVAGRLSCSPGFTCSGEIRIVDARVGAGVHFNGAQLSNPAGRTLSAMRLAVRGVVDCCEGFKADGEMSFASARLESELCFSGATIGADVILRGLRAAVLRTDHETVIDGTVDLRHATVNVLGDDPKGWPRTVRLDGFTYTTIVSPLSATERLGWLARDPDGYHPQPYEQLAAAYRAMGNDVDSRTVLLNRQRTRRHTLPAPLRAWGYLQDWIVGYGYRPQRAAAWLITLLVTGTIAFAIHPPAPLGQGPGPEFNPLLYTLDLLLPIVGFGQKGGFDPRGWEHWLAAGLIAAGWVLATTIAAGVTRVLSRQ